MPIDEEHLNEYTYQADNLGEMKVGNHEHMWFVDLSDASGEIVFKNNSDTNFVRGGTPEKVDTEALMENVDNVMTDQDIINLEHKINSLVRELLDDS